MKQTRHVKTLRTPSEGPEMLKSREETNTQDTRLTRPRKWQVLKMMLKKRLVQSRLISEQLVNEKDFLSLLKQLFKFT